MARFFCGLIDCTVALIVFCLEDDIRLPSQDSEPEESSKGQGKHRINADNFKLRAT
jgi:hypothetical protein